MKKLLIMFMVVAMASFLFVGCLGVTPEPDDPVDPDEPIIPVSIAPVIRGIENISLYSSETQYMNKAEVADGILVYGYAPKYSEVNIYIGGVVAGTGTAFGGDEEFTVFVSEDNLGADGAKTLYATATEVALPESDPSTEYAFTLDTVAPEMVEVAADLSEETATVTFDEAVDEDNLGTWTMKNLAITPPGDDRIVSAVELILPKVVELEVNGYGIGAAVGDLIRVACGTIEDLAGNEATDLFDYCFLEE